LLLDIILGREPVYLSYYVGGVRNGEPPQGNDLHQVEIDRTGLGKDRYVVVKIAFRRPQAARLLRCGRRAIWLPAGGMTADKSVFRKSVGLIKS
jgi:hypothetical protein